MLPHVMKLLKLLIHSIFEVMNHQHCLKTFQRHCPSLRGTSVVSKANGTEGVT